MITPWSLYAIMFNTDKVIAIVAPSISVAMTNAIEIANQQREEKFRSEEESIYTFADIVRVEEAVSKEVYVSPSIVKPKGGTTLDRSSREPVDRAV